jgi:hypothetical protein
MRTIELDALRAFAKTLEGQTLTTRAQRKPFQVRVAKTGLEYTPASTGKPRPQGYRFVQRFLDRYAETGSLHPGDYHDISVNASYLTALIERFVQGRSGPR